MRNDERTGGKHLSPAPVALGKGAGGNSEIVIEDDSVSRLACPEMVECFVDPTQRKVLGSASAEFPTQEPVAEKWTVEF